MKTHLLGVLASLCFLILPAFPSKTSAQSLPNYLPTDGLVAWFPFNGNADDESGNGNHGELFGATPTMDRFESSGAAFSFDGIEDYILAPISSQSSDGVTISVWIKCQVESIVQDHRGIVWSRLSGPQGAEGYPPNQTTGIMIYPNGLLFSATDGNDAFNMSEPTFFGNDGSWHHVACTYDASDALGKVFIDGQLRATNPGFSLESLVISEGRLFFGKDEIIGYGNRFWQGEIDDVGVWDRAITDSEILAIFSTQSQVDGCMDETACNFDPSASVDNGSCEIAGCTETTACNYDADAACDDGSCIFLETSASVESACYGEIVAFSVDNQTELVDFFSGEPLDGVHVCGCVQEAGGVPLELTAPLGFEFVEVAFASYGLPEGECGNFSIGSCHASSSTGVILGLLNQNAEHLSIVATNSIFGDPCVGISKRLCVELVALPKNDLEVLWQGGQTGWAIESQVSSGLVGASLFLDGLDLCAGTAQITVLSSAGCSDPNACNFDPSVPCGTSAGCIFAVFGNDCYDGGALCGQGMTWDVTSQTCVIDPTYIEDVIEEAFANWVDEVCGPGTFWDAESGTCQSVQSGCPEASCPSDLSGDGITGTEDLLMLLSTFGFDCPVSVCTEGSLESYNVSAPLASFYLNFSGPSSYNAGSRPAGAYALRVSGTFCVGSCWNGHTADAAFGFSSQVTPFFGAFTINEYCPQDNPGCEARRPSPDLYNPEHVYTYYFDHPGGDLVVYGIADECCWWDNQGGLSFELFECSGN